MPYREEGGDVSHGRDSSRAQKCIKTGRDPDRGTKAAIPDLLLLGFLQLWLQIMLQEEIMAE